MKSTTKQEKQFPHGLCQLRKTFSFLIVCILIALIFSGCDDTTISVNSGTSPDPDNFSSHTVGSTLNIGMSENDSLNPYFIKTDLNSDITDLVFEPLFYIDDSFCARNALAKSCTQNDMTLTVKLDTSVAFSDGVQFSSSDVVYSFNLAKQSTYYNNELSGIASAVATAADTVTFTLSTKSINAADSLSFPIVKTSTATDSNSVPVGTGLYKFTVSGEKRQLQYNPYCKKPRPNITTVNLVQIPASSTMIHTLELGTIDAFFDDLSSGSYSQANAQTAKTNLTNLVFLGMNSNSYGLSTSAVRQAVYYSINRQSIAKNSFKNYATGSAVPYHPEWHVISESEFNISDLTLNYSEAQKLMKNAGFNERLNYTLIVYSGNNFKIAAARELQENLQNIGINLTINELTWENYQLALSSGNYDFYIGEIRLPMNMNLSALFSDNRAVYGISATDTTATAYSEYLGGNISLEAFTNSFLQNMPFAPICFRMGALIYSNDITPAADSDMSNTYKNIYEWTIIN